MAANHDKRAEEVQRWLAFAALEIAARVLEVTASAPDYVRTAITTPSEVDMALVSRVMDLIGSRAARLSAEPVRQTA